MRGLHADLVRTTIHSEAPLADANAFVVSDRVLDAQAQLSPNGALTAQSAQEQELVPASLKSALVLEAHRPAKLHDEPAIRSDAESLANYRAEHVSNLWGNFLRPHVRGKTRRIGLFSESKAEALKYQIEQLRPGDEVLL
jgi:hypothetical protein